MSNYNTPIYKAIKEYVSKEPVPFHMPGHKLGKGIPPEFLDNLALWDLTEIPGTDNLHFPEGAIKEAQEMAAAAFGADETFFLVNGSTCGVQAMVMTICKPGDKLIVSRDCHKSVIHGMMLAGVRPVYIKPEFSSDFGISTAIAPCDLERVLQENSDAVGALITRPNYYGICSDIEVLSDIAHSHGKILAVDEAHGAHLSFNDRLPKSAMQGGADICVQSAHKTLPAFTQGAYLHVKSDRIDMDKLEFHLRMLQTSSPSYVIMAFLDIARDIMERQGNSLLDRLSGYTSWFEGAAASINMLKVLTAERIKGLIHDWTRIVVNVTGLGQTGFNIDRILRENYNIQIEMADYNNIVCISTIADRKVDFQRLYTALDKIAETFKGALPLVDVPVGNLKIPSAGMDLKDIMWSKGVYIKLKDAVGLISRSVVTPYPPGVPIICPGEIIQEDAAEYLQSIINSGGTVNGLGKNSEINVIG